LALRQPGWGLGLTDRRCFGECEHFVAARRAHRPQRIELLFDLQITGRDAVARVLSDEVRRPAAVVGGRHQKDAFVARQARLGGRQLRRGSRLSEGGRSAKGQGHGESNTYQQHDDV
jgi:hypothetical protein